MTAAGAGLLVAAAVVAIALACRPTAGRAVPASEPTARRATPLVVHGPRAVLLACVALGALLVAPPLLALIAVGGWARPRLAAVRRRRSQARAVTRALPDAVDLLLLCTSAGLSLPLAHPVLAERLGPPIGEALRVAASEADHGRPRADALVDALSPLGNGAARLAHAAAEHLRYGVPLGPALERLAGELRTDRRHLAEQEARRVPVRLLGPLVVCVLPAFALLTVVPLLAASLRALPV